MRSMEGTGGSGHPGGLAGGRPSRVSSPRYNGYDRSQRHRQRPRQTGDTSMDEIIQFVRGYQMERQPTLLRLQKKAPLPGIGQVSQSVQEPLPTTNGFNPNYRSYSIEEDGDGDDAVLNNEIAAIEGKATNSLRQHDVYDDVSWRKAGLSHTSTNRSHKHNHVGNRKGAAKDGRHPHRGKILKQLPPIDRDDIPERPTAPSPSVTPPVSGEELDSAGEPVDFIDVT